MYLPEELEQQRFADWNHMVKGLAHVWDIAELLGLTPCLAQSLQESPDPLWIEQLSQKGNCQDTLMRVMLLCWYTLVESSAHRPVPIKEFAATGVGAFPPPSFIEVVIAMHGEKEALRSEGIAMVEQ